MKNFDCNLIKELSLSLAKYHLNCFYNLVMYISNFIEEHSYAFSRKALEAHTDYDAYLLEIYIEVSVRNKLFLTEDAIKNCEDILTILNNAVIKTNVFISEIKTYENTSDPKSIGIFEDLQKYCDILSDEIKEIYIFFDLFTVVSTVFPSSLNMHYDTVPQKFELKNYNFLPKTKSYINEIIDSFNCIINQLTKSINLCKSIHNSKHDKYAMTYLQKYNISIFKLLSFHSYTIMNSAMNHIVKNTRDYEIIANGLGLYNVFYFYWLSKYFQRIINFKSLTLNNAEIRFKCVQQEMITALNVFLNHIINISRYEQFYEENQCISIPVYYNLLNIYNIAIKIGENLKAKNYHTFKLSNGSYAINNAILYALEPNTNEDDINTRLKNRFHDIEKACKIRLIFSKFPSSPTQSYMFTPTEARILIFLLLMPSGNGTFYSKFKNHSCKIGKDDICNLQKDLSNFLCDKRFYELGEWNDYERKVLKSNSVPSPNKREIKAYIQTQTSVMNSMLETKKFRNELVELFNQHLDDLLPSDNLTDISLCDSYFEDFIESGFFKNNSYKEISANYPFLKDDILKEMRKMFDTIKGKYDPTTTFINYMNTRSDNLTDTSSLELTKASLEMDYISESISKNQNKKTTAKKSLKVNHDLSDYFPD